MALAKEDPVNKPNLVVHREPQANATAGSKGSVGDTALKDALLIIGVAWIVLALLWLSLRRHNI